MTRKTSTSFVLVVLLFGIIYSLIALVNHYYFRTYALDLGVFSHALFDYCHFQWNDSGILNETGENLLADHFDLYLLAIAPLSVLFGTYTLLLVQIAFVLLGGIGVYRYFRYSVTDSKIPILAMLYFYLFFGVFSAVAFDYHSNVVAACLVPWFLLYLKKRKLVGASLLLIVVLVAKENMALWAGFICLGLTVEYWKDAYRRNYLAFASLFCFVFFVAVVSVIMPMFASSGHYPHFHYSTLGSSFSEAFVHLLQHPIESLQTLFINHVQVPDGDYVKAELHILLLISGLPLLLRKPHYLLMLVPVYFQKLFHDNYHMWGITGQYSIEFAPILAIGVFESVLCIKSMTFQKVAPIALVVLVFGSTFRSMDSTMMHTDKSRIRFYQARHYTRNYDVAKIHALLDQLPDDVPISIQSPFLPHLALRDTIYQFPMVKGANYVVFSKKENPYPLTEEEFQATVSQFENSEEWLVQHQDEDLTVLKRKEIR